MLDMLIVLVIVASSIWVYFDATSHKIGKISGTKSIFNMSAGAWAVVTLLLWIVGFPAYLVKRRELIDKAGKDPVEVSARSAKIAVLSIVGGLWVLVTFSSTALSALPACNSSDTEKVVGQIIDGMPLVQAAGAQYITLKDVVEQGYNQQSGIRSCSAILVTTAGENRLQYAVKWRDKDLGEFAVEAQIR